ncbi:hypothetical protein V5799_033332, partial [Amblyomma americanum]
KSVKTICDQENLKDFLFEILCLLFRPEAASSFSSEVSKCACQQYAIFDLCWVGRASFAANKLDKNGSFSQEINGKQFFTFFWLKNMLRDVEGVAGVRWVGRAVSVGL